MIVQQSTYLGMKKITQIKMVERKKGPPEESFGRSG